MTSKRWKILIGLTLGLGTISAVPFSLHSVFAMPCGLLLGGDSTNSVSSKQQSTQPWVSNGLISPEYATYLMAFKKHVNPFSKDLSLIYAAMGPDVITGLLLTNATSIWGIDADKIEGKNARRYLSRWNDLNENNIVPAEDGDHGIKDEYPNLEGMPSDQRESIYKRLWKEALGHRRQNCYWDVGAMGCWTLERLMVTELKLIGVDESSIEINDSFKAGLELSFLWGYPGETRKRRTIHLVSADIGDVLIDRKYPLPVCDVYYQKSAVTWQDALDLVISPAITHVNGNGAIIFGMPYGEPREIATFRTKLNSAVVSRDGKFSHINIDPAIEANVRHYVRGQRSSMANDDYSYGWRLDGFLRRTP